jgi:hypothetical protein
MEWEFIPVCWYDYRHSLCGITIKVDGRRVAWIPSMDDDCVVPPNLEETIDESDIDTLKDAGFFIDANEVPGGDRIWGEIYGYIDPQLVSCLVAALEYTERVWHEFREDVERFGAEEWVQRHDDALAAFAPEVAEAVGVVDEMIQITWGRAHEAAVFWGKEPWEFNRLAPKCYAWLVFIRRAMEDAGTAWTLQDLWQAREDWTTPEFLEAAEQQIDAATAGDSRVMTWDRVRELAALYDDDPDAFDMDTPECREWWGTVRRTMEAGCARMGLRELWNYPGIGGSYVELLDAVFKEITTMTELEADLMRTGFGQDGKVVTATWEFVPSWGYGDGYSYCGVTIKVDGKRVAWVPNMNDDCFELNLEETIDESDIAALKKAGFFLNADEVPCGDRAWREIYECISPRYAVRLKNALRKADREWCRLSANVDGLGAESCVQWHDDAQSAFSYEGWVASEMIPMTWSRVHRAAAFWDERPGAFNILAPECYAWWVFLRRAMEDAGTVWTLQDLWESRDDWGYVELVEAVESDIIVAEGCAEEEK